MPNNWDENGKVIEIALYTNTEEIYAVEDNNLNKKKVKIKGKIREKPDGKISISAHSFNVFDDIGENKSMQI